MADLLLVTTYCVKDIPLIRQRLEFVREKYQSIPNDILLIHDKDVEDNEAQAVAKAHEGLFQKVHDRKILDIALKREWPYGVNHAWRRTARIIAGTYGLTFDNTPYACWFYFEPDVTPLNKLFGAILLKQYAFHKKPFLGYVHTTARNDGVLIEHMNGAAVYPVSDAFYSPQAMLTDGMPWDVAGFQGAALGKVARIPSEAFKMAFGTSDYQKQKDGSYKATQTLRDGTVKDFQIAIGDAILHHGCKDGSLMNDLVGRGGEIRAQRKIATGGNIFPPCLTVPPPHLPLDPIASAIKADKALGMKMPQLCKKYKKSIKQVSGILKS